MICRLYTIVHCMIWICIAFCYCSMICCSYNHMHPSSHPSVCPSIRPSIHPPTCTYTAVHYTAVHYTASCYIALHYITLHCVTLHCVAVLSQFYHIILHYIPWHCVACYMALPTHTQIVYICTYIYIYTYNNVEIEQLFPSAAGGWTLPGPDGGRLGESGACQGQLARIEWHIEKIHNCSSTYRLRQRHCDLFKAMICAFWPVCCLTPWLKGLKHIYIYIHTYNIVRLLLPRLSHLTAHIIIQANSMGLIPKTGEQHLIENNNINQNNKQQNKKTQTT